MLQAQIITQPVVPAPPAPQSEQIVPIPRPSGEAGDGENGFNLRLEMGLGDAKADIPGRDTPEYRLYKRIQVRTSFSFTSYPTQLVIGHH